LSSEGKETLAGNWAELLTCLDIAWCRGPRERPFDPLLAMGQIETVIIALKKPSSTSPAVRREQALELAKALGDVRKILDRTIKMRPELTADFTWAWDELSGATVASVLFGPEDASVARGRQLQQAVDGVSKLETAANLVAQWHLRG